MTAHPPACDATAQATNRRRASTRSLAMRRGITRHAPSFLLARVTVTPPATTQHGSFVGSALGFPCFCPRRHDELTRKLWIRGARGGRRRRLRPTGVGWLVGGEVEVEVEGGGGWGRCVGLRPGTSTSLGWGGVGFEVRVSAVLCSVECLDFGLRHDITLEVASSACACACSFSWSVVIVGRTLRYSLVSARAEALRHDLT